MYIGLFTDDGAVEFFDVEYAPPRNQPPAKTITLADLIEIMRGEVTVRNEGVAPQDRYAPDAPDWMPPAGSLPAGLEGEEPLAFDEAISDEEDILDEES